MWLGKKGKINQLVYKCDRTVGLSCTGLLACPGLVVSNVYTRAESVSNVYTRAER